MKMMIQATNLLINNTRNADLEHPYLLQIAKLSLYMQISHPLYSKHPDSSLL